MPYIGQRPTKGDENNFKILDDISSYTLTFDGSDASVVSAANDTITSLNHRFITGQRVTYNKGGGTVITGLSDGVYYIIKEDHNTIKLATSASNAISGTAVNITNVGAGASHTIVVAFDGVNTKFKATHNNGVKAKVTRSAQLVISINGVIQQPHDSTAPSTGFGFDLDGVIVLSQAPASTDIFWAHVLTNNNVTFDISDNDLDSFTGNGSTIVFNLSKTPPDNRNILVTIDGVVQRPNDPDGTTRAYGVVENVLTFASAPASGTEIQVRHIGFAGSVTGGSVTNFYGRTGNAVLKSTDNIVVGDANITGNLTVDGDFTTLNTTLREVELLHVDANSTASAGIITQRGSGDILKLFDNNTEVLTVTDGGQVGINTSVPSTTQYLTIDGESNYKAGIFYKQAGVNQYRFMCEGGTGHVYYDIFRDGGDHIFRTNVAAGADEKLRITEEGNIGIGTAVPSQKLHLYGSTSTLIRVENSDDGIAGITFVNTGSSNWAIKNEDAHLRFELAGSEKVRINSSGYVGIGTGNLTAPLVVKSSENTLGILSSTDSGANIDLFDNDTQSRIRTVDGRLHLYADMGNSVSDSAIRFFVDGDSEKVRITGIGSVGIGVTDPETDFHVKGNLLVQNTIGNNLTVRSTVGNGNDPNIRFQKGRGGGTPAIVQDNDDLGMLSWAGYDGSAYEQGAYIYAEVEGTPASGDMPTRMVLATRASGAGSPTGRLTIGSDGKVTIQEQAIFKGNGNITEAIRFVPAVDASTQQEYGIGWAANFSHTHPVAQITMKEYDASDARGDLLFYTRGANTDSAPDERLRITSTGQVNIAPNNFSQTAYKVQIETGANRFLSIKTAAHDDFSDEGSGIFFSRQSDGSKELSGIFAHTNTSLGMASRGNLTFHAGGSGGYATSPERLRITNGGLVGIGTDNPLTELHVHGDTFTDITIHSERTSGNIGGINFRKGGVTSGIMTAQYLVDVSGNHYFHSQGSQRLEIASDGDLLITGSDNAELKLKCGTSTGNNIIAFLNSSGTTKGNIFYDSDNNFMVFKTNGTASSDERLRIASDGKVGINQSNPTQQLDVSGSIKLTAQLMQSMPADFWSQGNTFIELNGIGNLTHMGGYETNLTSNGYRDGNGQWVSYATNSYTGASQIGLQAQGNIIFRTDASKSNGTAHNPTERFRIASDGKLLVDHSASVGSGKLQVFTKTADALDILSFDDTAADGGRLTFYRNRNTTYGSNTKLADDDSLGRIDFRGMNTEGTDNYEIGASIRAEVDGTPGSGTDASDMPGRLMFFTTPDGSDSPTEKVRIDSAGQIAVGDGITVRERIHLHHASSDANYVRFTNSTTGNGTTDGLNIGLNAGEQALFWLFEDDDIIVANDNKERIRIHESGKISINNPTLNNQAVLHIDTTSTEDMHTVADQAAFTFFNDSHHTGSDSLTANRSHVGIRNDMENAITTGQSSTTGSRLSLYGIHSSLDTSKAAYVSVGAYLYVNNTSDNATTSQTIQGCYGYGRGYGTSTGVNYNIYGGYFLGYRGGNVNAGHCYGVYARAHMTTNGSGKAGDMTGGYFECEFDEEDVTNAYGVRSHMDRDAGTITNSYLFYGSYAGDGSFTNRWGIYIGDSAKNYLAGDLEITGTFEKGTDNFRIPHPLVGLSTTKDLVHSVIEGPQMDLIYRGKTDLVAGISTINIDTKAGMTEGTFVALCRDIQCFTSNETGWTAVKGSVTGNILTIIAQENTCTDTISWMVVGERQDDNAKSATCTDNDGNLIVEPDKRTDLNDKYQAECEKNIYNEDANADPNFED